MASRSLVAELQGKMEALENFVPDHLPSKENADAASAVVDPSLLREYQKSRDDYLKRRVLQTFLKQVETFDGQSFVKPPNVPTPLEQTEQEDQQRQVLADLQNLVQQIKSRKTELKERYTVFVNKKQELANLAQEYHRQEEEEGQQDKSAVEEPKHQEELDEETMAQQEAQLLAMQQRRDDLQDQLRSVQNETVQMNVALEAERIQFQQYDPALQNLSTDELAQENEKLGVQAGRLEEVTKFYQALVDILEELGDTRILNVDQAQDGSDTNEDLSLTVRIGGYHHLRVGLIKNKGDEGNIAGRHEHLKVVTATLLTDTLLQPPSVDQEGSTSSIALRIPDLADLVQLAETLAPGDNLRFVLRETAARIRIFEKRVVELAKLQALSGVVVKIGAIQPGGAFGGSDQEVVCSLGVEQITIVLRMTPDCPLVKNSVYIAQMVGLGGWDTNILDDIMERVNDSTEACCPDQVIQALRAELQRRQTEEGLVFPQTPRLPRKGTLGEKKTLTTAAEEESPMQED
jgi:hypothetical protein